MQFLNRSFLFSNLWLRRNLGQCKSQSKSGCCIKERLQCCNVNLFQRGSFCSNHQRCISHLRYIIPLHGSQLPFLHKRSSTKQYSTYWRNSCVTCWLRIWRVFRCHVCLIGRWYIYKSCWRRRRFGWKGRTWNSRRRPKKPSCHCWLGGRQCGWLCRLMCWFVWVYLCRNSIGYDFRRSNGKSCWLRLWN